jgi:Tol biopolymer transport system component
MTMKKTIGCGRLTFSFRRVFPLLLAAATLAGLPGCRLMVSQRINSLAFTSAPVLSTDIIFMYEDGSRQTPLTNNSFDNSEIAWSPDGSKIVFTSNRIGGSGGSYEIYIMNADGSNQERLTTVLQGYPSDGCPAWSRDGTKIAFSSYRSGYGEIFVMNADGSNQTQLTFDGGPDNRNPVWSPDGKKIAFLSPQNHASAAQIFVMDVDGRNRIPLAAVNPGSLSYPSWSPDGRKIAYILEDDNTNQFFLRSVPADGSGTFQNLTHNDPDPSTNNPCEMLYPAYSPDGTKIAFQSDSSGSHYYQIQVINSDGTGRQSLTANGVFNQYPAWSPDGTKIAWCMSSSLAGPYDIWIMRADGTGQFNAMPTSTANNTYPVWCPR